MKGGFLHGHLAWPGASANWALPQTYNGRPRNVPMVWARVATGRLLWAAAITETCYRATITICWVHALPHRHRLERAAVRADSARGAVGRGARGDQGRRAVTRSARPGAFTGREHAHGAEGLRRAARRRRHRAAPG